MVPLLLARGPAASEAKPVLTLQLREPVVASATCCRQACCERSEAGFFEFWPLRLSSPHDHRTDSRQSALLSARNVAFPFYSLVARDDRGL